MQLKVLKWLNIAPNKSFLMCQITVAMEIECGMIECDVQVIGAAMFYAPTYLDCFSGNYSQYQE